MELTQENTAVLLRTSNGEISESYLKYGLPGQPGGSLPSLLSSDEMTVTLSFTDRKFIMSSSVRGDMIRLEKWEDFAECAQVIIDKYNLISND